MDAYEKRYNEALERAMSIYKEGIGIDVIQYLFPELRESEDERIRKEIVSALKFANYDGVYDKHLAWLEKQRVNTDGDFARGYDCGYECCLNSHGAEWFEKQKEQKPAEVDESTKRLNENWMKQYFDEQKLAEWSEEDEMYLSQAIETLEHENYSILADKLKSLRPPKDCSACSKHLDGYISGRSDA